MLYQAKEAQKSRGCIYVKLFADFEFRGYYLEEHSDGTIDKTPLIIKRRESSMSGYRKYALFDWDNTIRRGYTLYSWVEYLHQCNITSIHLQKNWKY